MNAAGSGVSDPWRNGVSGKTDRKVKQIKIERNQKEGTLTDDESVRK